MECGRAGCSNHTHDSCSCLCEGCLGEYSEQVEYDNSREWARAHPKTQASECMRPGCDSPPYADRCRSGFCLECYKEWDGAVPGVVWARANPKTTVHECVRLGCEKPIHENCSYLCMVCLAEFNEQVQYNRGLEWADANPKTTCTKCHDADPRCDTCHTEEELGNEAYARAAANTQWIEAHPEHDGWFKAHPGECHTPGCVEMLGRDRYDHRGYINDHTCDKCRSAPMMVVHPKTARHHHLCECKRPGCDNAPVYIGHTAMYFCGPCQDAYRNSNPDPDSEIAWAGHNPKTTAKTDSRLLCSHCNRCELVDCEKCKHRPCDHCTEGRYIKHSGEANPKTNHELSAPLQAINKVLERYEPPPCDCGKIDTHTWGCSYKRWLDKGGWYE